MERMRILTREIKHRGKSVTDGEWVYGYYVATASGTTYIITKFEENRQISVEIIPETLGGFIGQHDCNFTHEYPKGKQIFKDDIVKVEDFTAVIEWDTETSRYIINVIGENLIFDFDNFYGIDLEIIGNRHDNPALLSLERKIS